MRSPGRATLAALAAAALLPACGAGAEARAPAKRPVSVAPPGSSLVSIAENIQAAFAVEGAVLVLRDDDAERSIARVAGDALVDRALLATGLPPPARVTTMGGHEAPCRVSGLGGRWPGPLVLAVTHPSGFGHSTLYTWTGARWAESPWSPDGASFVVDPAWLSGRGLLFGISNPVGDGTLWPRFALAPVPDRLPDDLVAHAAVLPEEPGYLTDTWVARDGTRITLATAATENRLMIDGRAYGGPAAGVERAPPVYVRADGTIVTGVAEPRTRDCRAVPPGADCAPRRAVSCDARACTTTDALPAGIAAFREVGGTLYAFAPSGSALEIHRLDGAHWTRVPTPGVAATLVTPIGDGDATSLLLLLEQEGARSLARWTP